MFLNSFSIILTNSKLILSMARSGRGKMFCVYVIVNAWYRVHYNGEHNLRKDKKKIT